MQRGVVGQKAATVMRYALPVGERISFHQERERPLASVVRKSLRHRLLILGATMTVAMTHERMWLSMGFLWTAWRRVTQNPVIQLVSFLSVIVVIWSPPSDGECCAESGSKNCFLIIASAIANSWAGNYRTLSQVESTPELNARVSKVRQCGTIPNTVNCRNTYSTLVIESASSHCAGGLNTCQLKDRETQGRKKKDSRAEQCCISTRDRNGSALRLQHVIGTVQSDLAVWRASQSAP
jgi:hypothetical protein